MRHMKKGSALNRTASHRRALMSNLITGLITHEKIRTTKAKAREVRPLAEKMITFAKRGDLHARRQVLRLIKDKEAVAKLFDTLGERFKDRPGGYTRILRMENRLGDNAEMALLELVTEDVKKGSGKKRRRRSKKKTAPEAAAQTPVVEEAQAEETEAPAKEAVAEAEEPATEEKAEKPAVDEKKD
jgi:large subunit ribosomal protein L17